jgi:hypothetical protein
VFAGGGGGGGGAAARRRRRRRQVLYVCCRWLRSFEKKAEVVVGRVKHEPNPVLFLKGFWLSDRATPTKKTFQLYFPFTAAAARGDAATHAVRI